MKSIKPDSPKSQSPRSPSMELTSTEDDEDFKAKFENVKKLVQHLKRELKYQRQRSAGLQSIAKCLEEERDENISLRSIITNLQQQRQKETGGLIDNKYIKSEYVRNNINELNKKKEETQNEQRIKTLEGQVTKLTDQLNDVAQMNSRWQVYNQQREELIGQLQKEINILKQANGKLEQVVAATETDKRKIDAMIYDYQQKVAMYKEDLERVQDENKRYTSTHHHLQENNQTSISGLMISFTF